MNDRFCDWLKMSDIAAEQDCVSINENWSRIDPLYWIRHDHNREPIIGLRFETPEINKRRYAFDQENYVIGQWCSWVRATSGQTLLTWPHETPLCVMQKQIESIDLRVLAVTHGN